MLHENDRVQLKHNVPANSLTAWPSVPSVDLASGSIGTVVMVYQTDSISLEYEVEFVDNTGYTIALLSLKEDDVESVDRMKTVASAL
jgi:hypothetical protein